MELAPSLQELFKNLQSQIITERDRAIQREKELDKKIDDETNRAKAAEKTLQDNIDKEAKARQDADDGLAKDIAKVKAASSSGLLDGISDGLAGQVLKINNTLDGIIADDDFRNCRVVSDSSVKSSVEEIPPINLATVFSSWYRFAHFNAKIVKDTLDHTDNYGGDPYWDGQNRPEYVYAYNWEYRPETDSIVETIDSVQPDPSKPGISPIFGFISPDDTYKNYKLIIKAKVGWDDDNIMIVCGYTKDSSGVEHTLMLVRGAGWGGWEPYPTDYFDPSQADTFMWWALIYDMGNATQHVLVNKNSLIGIQPTNGNPNTACYISLKRAGTHIEGKTSNFDNSGAFTGWREYAVLYWTLPSTQGSLPNQEFDMLTKMFSKKSTGNRIGFGVRSGQPEFSIVEQEGIFPDEDIIDLSTGEVERWDSASSSWKKYKTIEDKLPYRLFLYNKYTKKFFFYFYPGEWVQIS